MPMPASSIGVAANAGVCHVVGPSTPTIACCQSSSANLSAARRERRIAVLQHAIRDRLGRRCDVVRVGIVLRLARAVVRVADDVVRPEVVDANAMRYPPGKRTRITQSSPHFASSISRVDERGIAAAALHASRRARTSRTSPRRC